MIYTLVHVEYGGKTLMPEVGGIMSYKEEEGAIDKLESCKETLIKAYDFCYNEGNYEIIIDTKNDFVIKSKTGDNVYDRLKIEKNFLVEKYIK